MAKSTHARTSTAGAAQHPTRPLSRMADHAMALLNEIDRDREHTFAVAAAARDQAEPGSRDQHLYAVIERLLEECPASRRLRELIAELDERAEVDAGGAA